MEIVLRAGHDFLDVLPERPLAVQIVFDVLANMLIDFFIDKFMGPVMQGRLPRNLPTLWGQSQRAELHLFGSGFSGSTTGCFKNIKRQTKVVKGIQYACTQEENIEIEKRNAA